MTAVMKSVLDNGLLGNKAAILHGVPCSMQEGCLSGHVKHGDKPGCKPYLNVEEEQELTTHLIKASNMGYSKTWGDVLSIVEQYVNQKEDVSLQSSKITHGWWQKFLKRHPDLSLKSGDSTAGIRLDVVNPENLSNYFDALRSIFDEFDFDDHPEAIYNMDETEVPLKLRPPKVIAKRGQKKFSTKHQGKVANCFNWLWECLLANVFHHSLSLLLSKLIISGLEMKAVGHGMLLVRKVGLIIICFSFL